eukprot:1384901-Prymnesium_polylepis.1
MGVTDCTLQHLIDAAVGSCRQAERLADLGDDAAVSLPLRLLWLAEIDEDLVDGVPPPRLIDAAAALGRRWPDGLCDRLDDLLRLRRAEAH